MRFGDSALGHRALAQSARSFSNVGRSTIFRRGSTSQAALHVPYRESAFDPATVRALREILSELEQTFPELRASPTSESVGVEIDVRLHQGRPRVLGVVGLAGDVIPRLAARIRTIAQDRGLDVRVCEGGTTIDITPSDSYKGRAADAFAAAAGVVPDEVVRFGDQAAPGGNDATLVVGPRSFNVGPKAAEDPRARQTSHPFAEGTTQVLRSMSPSDVRAIATDFDRTLTMGDGVVPSDTAAELVRFLEGGTRVAVISGRGLDLFERLLPPLMAAGLHPDAMGNLVLSLFNGAVFVPAAAAMSLMPRVERRSFDVQQQQSLQPSSRSADMHTTPGVGRIARWAHAN